VIQTLDLIELTRRRLHVVIVDDGSTDGTFETACELASEFPQVSVLRQSHRSGLGSALDLVRQRFHAREVIAHDGVGPVDVNELMRLLGGPGGVKFAETEAVEGRGSRRFGSIAALNTRLTEAHRGVTSCHWLKIHEPLAPRRKTGSFIRSNNGASLLAPAYAAGANTCTSTLVAQ
jgi:glycosyltransferase involved in cell wall biosynthesis